MQHKSLGFGGVVPHVTRDEPFVPFFKPQIDMISAREIAGQRRGWGGGWKDIKFDKRKFRRSGGFGKNKKRSPRSGTLLKERHMVSDRQGRGFTGGSRTNVYGAYIIRVGQG